MVESCGRIGGRYALRSQQSACVAEQLVQYTLDSNTGQWTDGGIFGNTRGMKLAGLQRGKDYWARVRALGPDSPGGWSDAATMMVI